MSPIFQTMIIQPVLKEDRCPVQAPRILVEEFCCRMTCTMKEWYHKLGTFKQDELHRLETTTNILGVLHREFIGDMEMFDRKKQTRIL